LIPKDPDKFDIKQHEIEILTEITEFAKTDEYKNTLRRIKDLLEKNANIIDAEKEIGSNVLAFTSVPFSIFAFFRNPYSFKDALIDTVLVSRDRDTVGAMMSGLLGSFLGINNIPDNWINKLENKEYIRQLAVSLYEIKNREL
jgi:ADP-ribosylglycohydrolase